MIEAYSLATDRALGQLPISVGTADAFEPLFLNGGLQSYDVVLINLRTIVRNYYASLPKDTAYLVNPEIAANVILEELRTLASRLENKEAIVYWSEYRDLARFLPSATVKLPRTAKQYADANQEQATLLAVEQTKQLALITFKECDLDFKVKGRALLFSHVVMDLFSRWRFIEFDLLESYTGAIKGREEWYTKLTNGKDLTRMPFNKFTLSVFGDKGVFISPIGIVQRRALLALSEECNWTTVTTMDKIKSDLLKIPAGFTRDTLLDMARKITL